MNNGKILLGAFLALLLAVGVYFINRNWIAPITMHVAQVSAMNAGGNHPVAPDFSLTGINGEKVNLADYKGKVLMVDFWATWCGPCRVEIPGFVELENRYRDQGFAIVGISKDDGPDVVRDFYKEFKMNYPVALANDDVDQLYGGIIGLPTTFLIGRDGRIYAKHTGTTDISVFEQEIKMLLAAKPGAEVASFKPVVARSVDDIEVETPEQVKAENNPEVPGVDISGLTAPQITRLKAQLKNQPCTCGCKMSVLECRHKDPGCSVSKKMAKDQAGKLLKKSA
ncbi:MAG: TlpA family protein disulfide reductase [Terriglobia bacterium]